MILSATLLPVSVAQADKGGKTETCTKTVFVSAYAPANLTFNRNSTTISQVWGRPVFTLLPGQAVTVTATGAAKTNPALPPTGPNGDGPCNAYCLAPNLPAYALVGQVDSGQAQFLGAGPTTVTGSGPLYLAYNDRVYYDNSGGYQVTITYKAKPGHGYGDKNHYHCGPPGQNR